MEQLVTDVFELIQDYRADEDNANVQITSERINRWISQFVEEDRVFILSELKNVFQKNYCTLSDAKLFLKNVVEKLAKDKNYQTPQAFLLSTVFLDLQPEGKSQKKLLGLLGEVLKSEFSFDIKQCGTSERKYFVYLDDILCTGKTLADDITVWAKEIYQNNETHLQAIEAGKIELINGYIFIHTKNYQKKVFEFRKKLGEDFKVKMYRWIEIDNTENMNPDTNLGIVLPTQTNQNETVKAYETQTITQVDAYTDQKEYKRSTEEFYRPLGKPTRETFFSSPEARTRFENIMLEKGIEILKNANVTKNNIRALGYSLPSQKNFGFETLCFTWRNVPNNVPLVFWYEGGGNFPLFVVNRIKS